jgi:hypothetical protein
MKSTSMSAKQYREMVNGNKAAGRKKPTQNEHQLQVACVKWFHANYSQYAEMLFAIPNGGQRNVIVASKLKAEGVKPGIPDLMLAVPLKGFNGLFIELKVGKNTTSEHQVRMINNLRKQGYQCKVVYDLQQFMSATNEYLI